MRKIETNCNPYLISSDAMKEEMSNLQRDIFLMKELSTFDGFYQFYWEKCKNFSNNEYAFAYVNSLYDKLFGTVRFINYEAFLDLCFSRLLSEWKA